VERAQDLLRSANPTVTEICHLVGFSNLGSFSATFSQLVGVPPTEYRRVHVADSGPPPIPGCFLMAWSRPLPGSASEPSQIYEHDELLVLEDLVVEEAPAAGEDDGSVALTLDDVEEDAGGCRVDAQGRDDAGDIALELGWSVAELGFDPAGTGMVLVLVLIWAMNEQAAAGRYGRGGLRPNRSRRSGL
jgi:Helix-turn-helix domain